jgi:hypothetical protein
VRRTAVSYPGLILMGFLDRWMLLEPTPHDQHEERMRPLMTGTGTHAQIRKATLERDNDRR